MFRNKHLACALYVLLLALGSRAAQSGGFTPAQRAEIVSIVREALKHDPSIIGDAITALRKNEIAQTEANTRTALLNHQDELITPSDAIAGNPNGKATIIEFFDVNCPYCRSMQPTIDELIAHDSRVRVIYKDLPVLGAASLLSSKALIAAQMQGGYVRLRSVLMRDHSQMTQGEIKKAAGQIGLDWKRLSEDMDDPTVQKRINANLKLAQELEIQGTPTLIIGDTIVPGATSLTYLQQLVSAEENSGRK